MTDLFTATTRAAREIERVLATLEKEIGRQVNSIEIVETDVTRVDSQGREMHRHIEICMRPIVGEFKPV